MGLTTVFQWSCNGDTQRDMYYGTDAGAAFEVPQPGTGGATGTGGSGGEPGTGGGTAAGTGGDGLTGTGGTTAGTGGAGPTDGPTGDEVGSLLELGARQRLAASIRPVSGTPAQKDSLHG